MNWQAVIELAKNQAAQAHNATGSPTPPITIGDAARLITIASRAQPSTLRAWDWFPPALAALGYRKEGDKFPPVSDHGKLVADDGAAYVWTALDNLSIALDNASVPVNDAWLREAITTPPQAATQNLERVAWERLQLERKAGRAPSWTPGDPNAGEMPPEMKIPPQPDPTKIPVDKLPRPDKPVTDILESIPGPVMILGGIVLFIYGPDILRALFGGRD